MCVSYMCRVLCVVVCVLCVCCVYACIHACVHACVCVCVVSVCPVHMSIFYPKLYHNKMNLSAK